MILATLIEKVAITQNFYRVVSHYYRVCYKRYTWSILKILSIDFLCHFLKSSNEKRLFFVSHLFCTYCYFLHIPCINVHFYNAYILLHSIWYLTKFNFTLTVLISFKELYLIVIVSPDSSKHQSDAPRPLQSVCSTLPVFDVTSIT